MSILSILTSAVTAAQFLIPMPQQVQWENGSYDFAIPQRIENSCPELAQNIYLQDFTAMPDEAASRVCIIRQEEMPPEGYRLHVSPDTLLISANDKAGFIHAVRRSQWAKPELPVLGPRAARGQEGMGGKVGWASMLPGEVSSGRWEQGRDQKGEDLVYCFGPGNMSLFAGERSQERPRNKRGGQWWREVPQEGLGTRPSSHQG